MAIYFSHLLNSRQRHKNSAAFALPRHPFSDPGGLHQNRHLSSETLHAILLFQENQELLQFADAYVLIPFSMKKRPSAVCNKGYVSTSWRVSQWGKERHSASAP